MNYQEALNKVNTRRVRYGHNPFHANSRKADAAVEKMMAAYRGVKAVSVANYQPSYDVAERARVTHNAPNVSTGSYGGGGWCVR